MIYLRLFYAFLKIGLFNFGGGYAMISFLHNEIVLKQGWLTMNQFTDMVAVSQLTPGPVGINMATYTGYLASGNVWGALVATVAVCLPSFLILLILGKWLLEHQQSGRVKDVFTVLRLVVIGLIAAAALGLCNGENFTDYKSILIFLVGFGLVWTRKAGPILLLVLSALAGLAVY